MIMTLRIIVAVHVLFLFFLVSAELQASDLPTAATTDITQNQTEAGQFDPSLYVTPKSAIRNSTKQTGNSFIVDVRRKALFDRARIPGSINIPIYSIKTKVFLKNKPILLVNEGFTSPEMQRACSQLNSIGYHASILFGGIKLWREVGGPVAGDYFYLDTLNHISPKDYYDSSKLGHWVVINASMNPSGTAPETFPTAHHIPFDNKSDTFAQSIRNQPSLKKRDRFSSVLVFDQDGTHYEKMGDDIKNARLSNVYYLAGGYDAYRQFLQKLTIMKNHEKGAKVSVKKCGTCP
jgi:rhodanese-related sulfurtransferase